MFTGIVEKLSKVHQLKPTSNELIVDNPFTDVTLGESIAVNGVCLTVTNICETLSFILSPETFFRTNLSSLKEGHIVNLERALRPSDRISGHFVLGHVDAVGSLAKKTESGSAFILEIAMAENLVAYCVPKGSITVDGISLTINEMTEKSVCVTIIPHTWEHTNLKHRHVGDLLNIEVDVLSKHIRRFLDARSN
ncbi:MAG: riboflavin synthase [Bacteriovoracia bacterium]